MGDSPPLLDKLHSTTNSTNSSTDSKTLSLQSHSQIKPRKIKRPPSFSPHSASAYVVGPGTAVLDRHLYNLQRTYEPATPAQRVQTHHGRAQSLSSTSLTNSSTNTPSLLSSPPAKDDYVRRPFTMRNSRRYLADPTLRYPLPVDLPEMHRQVLRTMLLVNVFGGPICSPNFRNTPPKKVLEVGCGNGYWSALCHKHFARQGHSVSFTGIDIAPLSADNSTNGMKWRFVQHDLRNLPTPFQDEEFDLVMVKDLSMISSQLSMTANLMDEYLRILRPGGAIEVWDGDHTIRMVLSHSPTQGAQDSDDSEDEDTAQAEGTGTYILTAQTPFTEAQNPYLTEYNTWLTKAFDARGLSAIPCTSMASLLLQEPELADIESRRLAIPLGEVRWERAGTEGSTKGKEADSGKKVLTTGQTALRHTALLTLVQYMESLEPFLREASGKSQDEWDRWYGDMMNDLLVQNGTSWGECLEVGAWWATKRDAPKTKPKPSEEKPDKPMPYPPDPHPGDEWKIPHMELL
ncbi:hypothetical protein V498_00475 [Pseudogymnoascus sp. VKM F-4517 (FW-2822)]|nr:hypothetical protein V498_00475 [Pseudogymnoascus sp. VKM F-4517 (FW-2822)]